MARLRSYSDFRFVGDRLTMVVYDTDDDGQAEQMQNRIVDADLFQRNLVSTFAPDTLDEARNRGFTPA